MILEIATFNIDTTNSAAFEKVLPEAIKVISRATGFIDVVFQHCIEEPEKYIALIQWETLEDHTDGFRNSDLFLEWRAVLSPFFQCPPSAIHFKQL